jgi:hypothetical protein
MLPENEWWKGYALLAKFEAIAGRFSDAIGALNDALLILRNGDEESRWKILTQRARYYMAAEDPHSAHSDLMEAARLRPSDIPSARMLAELKLFGPPVLYDPDSAELLFEKVCSSGHATPTDRMHLLLSKAVRNPAAVVTTLRPEDSPDSEELDETDLMILEIIRIASSQSKPEGLNSEVLRNADRLTPGLTEWDRQRLETALRLLNHTKSKQLSGTND